MGLYTSIAIHSSDQRFVPDEAFLWDLLGYFDTPKIEIASGERTRIWGEPKELFFLNNVSLDYALAQYREKRANSLHLMLRCEGRLKVMADSLMKTIPEATYGDFWPWDTGITLGKWAHLGYDTGKKTASGRFAISKSASGCPPSLNDYLEAFLSDPEVEVFLEYLKTKTGRVWRCSINLT